MKHFWMAIVLIGMAGAAMSLWKQQYNIAFVMATVGALAWFLNYRARLKETINDRSESENNELDHANED